MIVTNGERRLIETIDELFPQIVRLRCWNHLFSDIEIWVKRHGGLKHDYRFYKTEARELFKSTSFDLFITNLDIKKNKWDDAYTDYFKENILPEAERFGRWNLEKMGFYCPYGGLTTNISEGNLYNTSY